LRSVVTPGTLRERALAVLDCRGDAAGIGFADVVKRPTPRADLLTNAEKRHGVGLLAL
jgi:hypothetical protein